MTDSLPSTEDQLPASADLDRLGPRELITLLQDQDATVAAAVRAARGAITRLCTAASRCFARGGRLIYGGAGTSGRLGILDAVECVPTFRARPDQVIGRIAGGSRAFMAAVEGAEDDRQQGAADLLALEPATDDLVVGIAAGGRTPWVLGLLDGARRAGCTTGCVVCTEDSPLAAAVDLPVVVVTGAEVLTGSTRLKAGTATKMVLNQVTTAAFVLQGKTYGNLMVDVLATNDKLRDRSVRILCTGAGVDRERATELLTACNGEVKTALVAAGRGVDPERARALLAAAAGRVRDALTEGGA